MVKICHVMLKLGSLIHQNFSSEIIGFITDKNIILFLQIFYFANL